MIKPIENTITIHTNIEISPSVLSTIVATAKTVFGKDQNGHYRMDTADLTSQMISRFLLEKDFESYVKNKANYIDD